MRIDFDIHGVAATYTRNWFTGRATLQIRGESKLLQNPWDLRTHASATLTRAWRGEVDGYEVMIVKVRPLLLAGFRPQKYQIFVDQNLVMSKDGY